MDVTVYRDGMGYKLKQIQEEFASSDCAALKEKDCVPCFCVPFIWHCACQIFIEGLLFTRIWGYNDEKVDWFLPLSLHSVGAQ